MTTRGARNMRLPWPSKQQSLEVDTNWTDLEVKTVEQLGDEREGREEDLQGIDVCSMSLTQLNSGLQWGRDKNKYKHFFVLESHHNYNKHFNIC